MRHFSTLNILLLSLLIGGIHASVAEEMPKQESSFHFKQSDFSFTGFTNFTYMAPSGQNTTLNVDDLGVFGSGHLNRALNPFFEAELAGVVLAQQGGDPLSAGYPHILLERFYNDSELTNNLTLRIGKILSPVGEWNLVHVPPLVMTTVRPLVSFRGFSEFASGASLLYSGNKGMLPDIQVYADAMHSIRPRPQDIIVRYYKDVSGLHLNWPLGLNDKVGLSLQRAQVTNTGEHQILAGINFNKEFGPLELDTEAFHTQFSGTRIDRLRDNEWGAYVQGTYELSERWHLVGRYEYFVDRGSIVNSINDMASRNALLGVAYKAASASPRVWKLEYIQQYGQQLDIQTGLYASFSNLF